jgi:hypothetical protein
MIPVPPTVEAIQVSYVGRNDLSDQKVPGIDVEVGMTL